MFPSIYTLGINDTDSRKKEIIGWFYANRCTEPEVYLFTFPERGKTASTKTTVSIEDILDLINTNSKLFISSTFDPVTNPIPEDEWQTELSIATSSSPYYSVNIFVDLSLKLVKQLFKLK